jgi:hypothetical protein
VNIDTDAVVESNKKVKEAIENLRFPIPSGNVTIKNPVNSNGDLRVTSVGSDLQKIIDRSVSGTTYRGLGARGIATSDDGWLIRKRVKSGTTTTDTNAIDSWVNRATATYS